MAEQDAQDGWSGDGLPPEGVGAAQTPEALAMMMDIPLDVTVELGRASLTLAEVLALGPGSVVELDRLPGEPLELFANGRLIARGEVVVLNDTFGLRVTEIVQNARGRGA
jgi:flagellar motor switch protein FliN